MACISLPAQVSTTWMVSVGRNPFRMMLPFGNRICIVAPCWPSSGLAAVVPESSRDMAMARATSSSAGSSAGRVMMDSWVAAVVSDFDQPLNSDPSSPG